MTEKLLSEVETFLVFARLSPSKFGRLVFGDNPGFVSDLRKGQQSRPATIMQARRFMETYIPVPEVCPFWSKAEITGAAACWQWRAAKNARGYGNYRSRSAHVVAYEKVKGAVPRGLQIDHLCRNKSCVNPMHLEAVTPQENVRRYTVTVTHCIRGHPLSGDNLITRIRPTDYNRRECRICSLAAQRRRYAVDSLDKLLGEG